jgi:hypothetical protein
VHSVQSWAQWTVALVDHSQEMARTTKKAGDESLILISEADMEFLGNVEQIKD